jgi:hypothetical protein
LRPDDVIDFVITASDPYDAQLKYGIKAQHNNVILWQKENTFSDKITEDCITMIFTISLYILSPRKHHAFRHCDDHVEFVYTVLPSKPS